MKNSKKGVLSVISISVLLASLGTSIVNVALPTFTIYFNTSFNVIQWTVISYLLAITVSVTIVGKLADKLGYNKVYFTGILIFTITSLLSAFTSNIFVLIILRGFQGIGAATLTTISLIMVKNNIANIKVGYTMGLIGTISAIGTAAGPSVGGLLLSIYGWQSIFILLTAIGSLAFILGILFLENENKINYSVQKINARSILLLILTISSFALSMTFSKDKLDIKSLILLFSSFIFCCVFFHFQKKDTHPLIEINVLKNKALTASLLANFMVSNIMMTTLIVGPFFLTSGIGLNTANVGLIMSIGPVISILTGIPTGKIVDKIGAQTTLKIGLLFMLSGTLVISILPSFLGLLGYISGIILLTPGYQLFQSGNNTLVMLSADKNHEGIIAGILNLSRNLGLVTGASIMGGLFFVLANNNSSNKSQATFYGLKITFLVISLLLLIIVCRTLLLASKKSRKQ